VALINHSCNPNARIIAEGAQLHLRALTDLCTGDKLTVSYCPRISKYHIPSDFQGRQEYLKPRYGFDCTCDLCKLGQLGPKGDLRDRIQKFLVESPVYMANRHHQRVGYLNNYGGRLASLVVETRYGGYPLGAYPWLPLCQRGFEVNVTG
jgi:hypothetical protein